MTIHPNTQEIDLGQLIGLSEADRLAARDTARQNAIKRIGPRPERPHYQDRTASAYPKYVTITVTVIMLVLLAAFFAISAQRLYSIGKEKFTTTRDGNHITFDQGGTVAGIAIVIGSEAAALGFWLSAGVLAKRPGEKRTLYALALASTALALIGNGQFALGGDWSNLTGDPFSIIEALLPPVVVLGAGLTFERLFIDDIARRHANETAFQNDLASWQYAADHPEEIEGWKAVYMHALKAELIRVNGSGRGQAQRREIMSQMSGYHWRVLVENELRADDWTAADPAVQYPESVQKLPILPALHDQDGKRFLAAAPDVATVSTSGRNGHS